MRQRISQVCRLFLVVLAVLVCQGAMAQAVESNDGAMHISIVSLLSSPERYDGELVRVEGFLYFRMGNRALYLSEDAAIHGIIASGFWLNTSPATMVASHRKKGLALTDLDRRYVSVTGVFDTTVHGHLGAFSAGLRDVELVHELRVTK